MSPKAEEYSSASTADAELLFHLQKVHQLLLHVH